MGSVCVSEEPSSTVRTDGNLKPESSIDDAKPLFSIGIIADPQYADEENGQNYTKTRTRRYRQALTLTQNAVKTWNDESKCKVRPSLIICLGDIIDGLCKTKHAPSTSVEAMESILGEFSKFIPFKSKQAQSNAVESKQSESKTDDVSDWITPYFHNCIGNHELYNFDRKELSKYQKSECIDNGTQPADYIFYYSFTPFPGHLFIVLDAFVIANIGYSYCDNKHPNYEEAVRLLDKFNPHDNKEIPPTSTEAIPDLERFAAWNGGFGEKQLKWLEAELKGARERNDKVFIFSHVPLVSTVEGNPFAPVAWDYKECKAIVDEYDDVVKTFFAGHDHDGDKKVNGIVHRTFEGVIESGEGTDCFATVYFYKNKMGIQGYGRVSTEEYKF